MSVTIYSVALVGAILITRMVRPHSSSFITAISHVR